MAEEALTPHMSYLTHIAALRLMQWGAMLRYASNNVAN